MKPIPMSKIVGLLGMVLVPNLTLALPVKYPDCANSVRVKDVPGGHGTFFNEDCTTIYVLPPKSGELKVSGYRPSANLDLQCGRLQKIEKDIADLEELKSLTSVRLLQYEKDIQEIEANLRDGLVPVGKTVADMEAKMDALIEKASKLRTQIIEWQQQGDDQKVKFAQAEGGRGVFSVESTYAELLNAYRKANPDLHVEAMVLDQTFVSVNEQKADASTVTQMPAVLSLKLIGLGEIPILRDPSIVLQHPNLAPYTAPAGSKIFGGALAGEIQVSNVGACGLREAIGSQDGFTASDVKDYIAAGATYSYQVQVTRKHAITYNIKELIRQIREQSKRGGLFSRKTLSSFVDERQTSSWIEFHVESQDSRFEYTDDYIKQVKAEFISRALAQVVSIQTGSPAAVLALIDPSGKNGADTISDGLGKCPHLYCQMGAAGFKALSAIFGSEKATASLLKKLDGSMSETVVEKRMVPGYGTYKFE